MQTCDDGKQRNGCGPVEPQQYRPFCCQCGKPISPSLAEWCHDCYRQLQQELFYEETGYIPF